MKQSLQKKSQSSVRGLFVRYTAQNILGMLGISAYVLADTFFISRAEGTRGITALNLVLPIYSLIFAIGAMLGVGSATRFAIHRARGEQEADSYLGNALVTALVVGIPFILIGLWVPDQVVAFLGGNGEIVAVGTSYTRIFLLFAPAFMWNYICNAFVRNDGNPSLAMAATLSSSLFNIVMDYVLMFPLGMGMAGAALATAISPIVGILICCIHLLSPEHGFRIYWNMLSGRRVLLACQLGVSAFVGEISSGVTTVVFNFLILRLAGNVGVAAYGVVANIAIVSTAIFSGISQGTQPLFSEFYGKNDRAVVRQLRNLAMGTGFVVAACVLGLAVCLAEPAVGLFNSAGDAQMTVYGVAGMRLYFIGYLFAGLNIVGTGYLSATEVAGWAFAASVLRGFVAIVASAFVMSWLFGMTGIWLAFTVAEGITFAVIAVAIKQHG
ncbi:MAG: MATE family efflux transporter [Lachnospiraceae bacterium]|nr:MATE family efflux transporter [Lachnospiraceae bacterium]